MRGRRRPAAAGGCDVVATTGQAADFAREVGGERVRVTGLLAPNADPHAFELRPDDVKELAGADLVVRSGGDLDEWLDGAIDSAGTDAQVVDARGRASARRRRPALVAGPAQRDRGRRRAARRARSRPIPPARPPTARRAAAYTARLERLDARSRAASPRSRSADRTLVTTHDSLGYYARRYGIRVVGAVIPSRSTVAQPSAGEIAALVATIRREHVKAVFAESSVNPDVEEAIARESGARIGRAAVGRLAGPGGLRRRHLRRLDRLQHRRARRRVQRRRDRLPAGGLMLDLSRPYLQRALLEMLLLAVPAGLLGSWIVLRRLAFFTHAVGTVSFPALVLASAWGIAPQLAALAAALGFGVAQERLVRTRRLGADAATGPAAGRRAGRRRRARLRRVRVRRGGRHAAVRLADRAERDATCGSPRWSRPPSWRSTPRCGGTGSATGFEPASARALGLRPVLADRLLLAGIAAAAVVALDAVGALLVTVVLVVPAATARLLTDRLAPLQLGAIALAAVEGVAAVWLADALNVGAGPGAGGARRRACSPSWRARRRCARGRCRHDRAGRRRARPLRRLRAGPRRAARRLVRRRPRRDRRRARPQRRRQDDALPRAARRAPDPARRDRAARPAGLRAPDRARAARLPGQRVRRRADGRLRAHAVVPARRPRATAPPRARRWSASGSRTRRTRASARSRAASASAC